ncbi:MAG TPA: terminase [Gammaproteobacteria bacterium]|nr:terminase [Gammaproteobacteria bacterium]MCH79235.1 terminase [Gammaproteobacteria bacterium]
MSDLAELLERLTSLPLDQFGKALDALPKDEREKLEREALEHTKDLRWVPNPGPQWRAFYCEADELLFGGEPGGGKSQVGIGLALGPHERSLLLRRTAKEAGKFVEEIEQVLGTRDGFNGQRDEWRVGGKLIDIGGCQLEEDKQKYKGTPHDLIFFDELTDFSEAQYLFIGMWNRSTKPGQRCRIVSGTNGPSTAQGLWVVKRWAAWLDPQHTNPAADGELRWYYTDDEGHEVEDTGPGEHVILGRVVRSRSRTFIRSRLIDNPDLAATDYGSHLMSQTGDMRRIYALGDFGAMLEDRPNQAIPTVWVQEAQERWTAQPPVGVPMCSIGVDVAQGGKDQTTIARRYDSWFAKILAKPGRETKNGEEVAAFVLTHRRDNALVVVDVGGGWGADALAQMVGNSVEATGYMGVKTTQKRSKDMRHRYRNVRTEAYMALREALNPGQPGGSQIALPPSRTLLADLTAPDLFVTGSSIELESKEAVTERLGRSPDEGDAVVMAWWGGARMASHFQQWPVSRGNRPPEVITGRKPLSSRGRPAGPRR